MTDAVPAGERREAMLREWYHAISCAAEWTPSSGRWADRVIAAGEAMCAELAALPAARPEPPAAEPIVSLASLMEMARCKHEKRSGGNDYLLCDTCGLAWDYRREGPNDALVALVAMVSAPPAPCTCYPWDGIHAVDCPRAAVHAQEGPRDE